MLLDKMDANMDSASQENYLALPLDLNLDDQLFKYGIRIDYNLVQDKSSGVYPIITGETNGKPQIQLVEWPYFPLVNHYSNHPITRNLDAVLMKFVSSMDTVRANGIKKTPLLLTSPYSRSVAAPVNVSVQAVFNNRDVIDYKPGNMPVGYLLEGSFSSLYKNRFLPEGVDNNGFMEEGLAAKIIIVADGDVARNNVNLRTGQPQPLGFDPPSNYTFANQDFLLNAMAYLVDENGLIKARNKQVMIRPLNKVLINSETLKWQLINLVAPLLMIVVFGILKIVTRKQRFAKFK